MEQIVRVTRVCDDGTATVLHVRQSACSGDCHKCAGCGAAQESMVFPARNPIGATPGDVVVVKGQTAPVMKAAGAFYVVPMILFFLGYWLGERWRSAGTAAGCAGFVLGIVLAVVYDRTVARKEEIIYTITGFAEGQLLESGKKGDNCRD